MRISIDLAAYRRNLESLRQRLAPTELMAVVKDDAYGHGREQMVRAAREVGVSHFAVLDPETGIAMRGEGVPRDVMLLAWLFRADEDFVAAVTECVDLGVSSVAVLDLVARASRATGVTGRVHLKIDTGLRRNGADPEIWSELVARAADYERDGLVRVVGIWTHIGEASDEDDDAAVKIFTDALRVATELGVTPEVRHVVASAASLARPEFRFDLARVGGFTYGVAPGAGLGPAALDIEPVMTATAEIISERVTPDKQLLVVDAGHLDGIPYAELLGESSGDAGLPRPGFDVSWRGLRFPIISVDDVTLTVDITGSHAAPEVGESVVLFGSHLRHEPVLQEWADALGTVGEEIVVRLGGRAERSYEG